MGQQQWRLRIRGKQRKEVDINLLVAAFMAFGEQLHAEQREQPTAEERVTPLHQPQQEETE